MHRFMHRLILALITLLCLAGTPALAQDGAVGVPSSDGMVSSDDADDAFEQPEDDDEPSAQTVEMPDLDAMYNRAARRAGRNDITGAIEMFKEIYEWDDQWVDPVWNIGNLSEHLDDYQSCSLWFRRYLAIDPEASDAGEVRDSIAECESRIEDAGTLEVTGIAPEHAKVSVDGLEILNAENLGPVALAPGDYMLTAAGYDHEPWSMPITIAAGETTSVDVEMTAIIYYGTLLLEVSEPGAAIALDGESLGSSPMAEPITLAEGEYLVEVTLDGYYPWRRYIRIVKDVDDRTIVDLIDESVDLDDL